MTSIPTQAFSLRSEAGAELAKLSHGDALTIGRDALNRVQIGHGSIEPFHARLRCDDWGVWITPLPGAIVSVAGELTTEERAIPIGARLVLGSIPFDLVATEAEHAPPSATRAYFAAVAPGLAFLASMVVHLVAIVAIRHWFASDGALAGLGSEEEEIGGLELVASAPSRFEPAPRPPAPMPRDFELPPPPEPAREIESLLGSEALTEIPDVAAPGGGDHEWPDRESLSRLPTSDALPAHTIGVGVGGGRGGGGLRGSGTLSLGGGKTVGGLASRLRALRGSGVDLVFVIDTTSSMRPFLEGARVAADKLVTTLATLVEDLQVGVVAYRDQGDDYTTKVLPLGDDRYAILNFLWSLRPEGGGDIPEAVAEGLAAAIEKAQWRPRTHRVIVVVGDAPPHAQDWPRLKGLARGFVRKDVLPGAVISSIHTGAARDGLTSVIEDGAGALAEIARLGGGDYLDLAGPESVGERLLLLAVGPRHAKELAELLAQVQEGSRDELIRRRVGEGDRTWLLERLRRPPIHPAVVDGLIELADRRVLWEARKMVAEGKEPRSTREAALYILRRCLPPAAELELDQEDEAQRAVLNRLDALILHR